MRIWEPFPHATEFLNPAIKQLPLCHCGNRICVLEFHSLLLPLLLLPTSPTPHPYDFGAFSGHNWKKKPWNDAEKNATWQQVAHPHLCCLTSFQCYLSRHGRDHTRTRLTQIPGQVGILKVWTPILITQKKNYGHESADFKTYQLTLCLTNLHLILSNVIFCHLIASYLKWPHILRYLTSSNFICFQNTWPQPIAPIYKIAFISPHLIVSHPIASHLIS